MHIEWGFHKSIAMVSLGRANSFVSLFNMVGNKTFINKEQTGLHEPSLNPSFILHVLYVWNQILQCHYIIHVHVI